METRLSGIGSALAETGLAHHVRGDCEGTAVFASFQVFTVFVGDKPFSDFEPPFLFLPREIFQDIEFHNR